MGLWRSKDSDVYIVQEFMAKGSALPLIQKGEVPLLRIFEIMNGIANGMAYLVKGKRKFLRNFSRK